MNENKRTLTVTPRWAITIVTGAILTGMVTGAFGILSIANSDHFALLAVTDKVNRLEQTTVNKETYEIRYDTLNEKIDVLGKKMDTLINSLYIR